MEEPGFVKSSRFDKNNNHYEKEHIKLLKAAMRENVTKKYLQSFNFKKTNMAKIMWSHQGCRCTRCMGRYECGRKNKEIFEYNGKLHFLYMKERRQSY